MNSTNLRGSPRGWWGRRLFVLAFFVLVAGLAAAVPRGTAADSPYLNVWVHYDYMVGPGYSDAPSAAAIQTVVDALKAHGVTLHIDPKHAAIPGHSVIVPDFPGGGLVSSDPSCAGTDAVRFSALKAQYFHPSSNHPWHYAIFGNGIFSDSGDAAANCPATYETGFHPPLPGMTGFSQLGYSTPQSGLAYNLVVAVQPIRDCPECFLSADQAEAAIFMHELGHNFGLRHGGWPGCLGSEDNLKPNYLSVMNYDFYAIGIP